MFEYILFDLDGTLTDPFDGITASVVYALEKCGIVEKDRKKLSVFIGPPLMDSFRDFYGMNEERARTAVAYYREYYSVYGIYQNTLYDGIPELLQALTAQNKRCYLATSKPQPFAELILRHFGLIGMFTGAAGATMDERRTDKADVIAYALDRFRIPKERAVMVGDRKYDVIGAKRNGIPCVGALYGFGSREELIGAGAIAVAPTPNALLPLL